MATLVYANSLAAALVIVALGVLFVGYLLTRLRPLTLEQEKVLRFRDEVRRHLNRIIY